MQRNYNIIPVILLFSCLAGCSQDNNTAVLFEKPGYQFPYELTKPVQTWKLPSELIEISGVAYIDNQRLACVQDEKGIIYIFNQGSGKIESQVVFGEDGDYEGIDIVGNDAWVLKSNGMLVKVENYLLEANPVVKKFKTALSGKNDAEGLAYEPVSNNLLVACKENPFLEGKDGAGYRAVYRFSLETLLLDLKPYLLVNQDSISYYKGNTAFSPSGIAVQPVTGNIFIIGSAGKLLLVYSGKGEMLAMIPLSPMMFPQPEGICFSPDGTLYISNEGAGRAGTILKFSLNNAGIF
jgi:uncharacterized protein YjiK